MSEVKFFVYILKFPNSKIYIGQTKNIKIRWEAHGIRYKNNKQMYMDILKYGWDNIQKDILLITDNREMAYEYEKKYIQLYNSTNEEKGYNKSIGGKFPTLGVKRKHSELSKKKMSESKLGKHYSPSTEFPSKKIICVETQKIFESISEAERKTGILHSHISQVCNGIRKTTGGYHWDYYKVGEN